VDDVRRVSWSGGVLLELCSDLGDVPKPAASRCLVQPEPQRRSRLRQQAQLLADLGCGGPGRGTLVDGTCHTDLNTLTRAFIPTSRRAGLTAGS
jgi:hypothetical protein